MMNTLMTIDPWRFLDEVFEAATPAFETVRARAAGRFPPLNVYQDDNAVALELQLPGKTAKDVDLTLEPQAVVIADKPAEPAEGDAKAEPKRPAWSRRVELPFRVDAEKANAKFTNGILHIELPRAENTGVRRIAIAG